MIESHPHDAVALMSRGRRTTYGELREQVARLRGGLLDLGLDEGDRVGVVCGNNWYFAVSYLAVLGAGLVAVPLNPASPPRELERELAVIGARAAIVGPSGRKGMSRLDRSQCPALEHLIVSEGDWLEGALKLDDLLAARPRPLVERQPDDLAVLMFTSGTAGRPKAAMLSHSNLSSNIAQMTVDDVDASPADVNFGVLPLFHIFGLNVVLGGTLTNGASVVLIERFDPVSAVETIENHKVTGVAGPPNMWAALAALPDVSPAAFRTVRRASSGAAKLTPEVAEQVRERLGVTLREGYGLTEASPVVTSTIGLEPRLGSIGVPVADLELRVVDADGEDVLIGDAGEIWVKGPNVFRGYWNDPEATSAALTEDGWLRTGDIAVVDDDGFLYLVDRAKDLIIVSGFNVYPAEVEDVLLEHPAVDQCAVIGVAHPYTGEAVKAYVVLAGGARSIEEDELIDFCADRLARYKCPDKVMFVDQLPRNVTGKIMRRALS